MITLYFHLRPQFKYELFHILHITSSLLFGIPSWYRTGTLGTVGSLGTASTLGTLGTLPYARWLGTLGTLGTVITLGITDLLVY